MPVTVTQTIPDNNLDDASMRFWRKAAGSFGIELSAVRNDVNGGTTVQRSIAIESTLEDAVSAGAITGTQRTNLLAGLNALRSYLRGLQNLQP